MKYSIVTVAYNCRQLIERTIKSVIEQSFRGIEYIIIDGGSSDGTTEIIEKYKNQISYYISEPDDGIYNAMNKAIKVASGDYLYFLNAGDFLVNDVIGTVDEYLSINSVDVLYGDILEGKNGKYHMELSQIECIDWRMNICHQSIFVKNNGFVFDEQYKIAADYELTNRLYNEGYSFQYIPIPIAHYETGGVSFTQKHRTRIEFAKIACLAQIRYKNGNGISRKIIADRFMDAINRVLFVNNEIDGKINQFINQYIIEENVIIWGIGEVARLLIPKIKNAGKRITLIVDNNCENKGEVFEDISISTPELLTKEENKALIILSEKFCDEIYAQAASMGMDSSVRIYKFTDINKDFISQNKEEIEKYIIEHYDFYEDFLALK